mgnify:CR=1 FL=1
MGTIHPHESTQLSLSFEAGVSVRHPTLRACMASGVYQRGHVRQADRIDEIASHTLRRAA